MTRTRDLNRISSSRSWSLSPLLYVVGAGLFIVVAPFVHVGTFHLLGSDRLAVLITGVSMLVVLFVLAMTGMFNFT